MGILCYIGITSIYNGEVYKEGRKLIPCR